MNFILLPTVARYGYVLIQAKTLNIMIRAWRMDDMRILRDTNIECTIRMMYIFMRHMHWPVCGPIYKLACSMTLWTVFIQRSMTLENICMMAKWQPERFYIRYRMIWVIQVE